MLYLKYHQPCYSNFTKSLIIIIYLQLNMICCKAKTLASSSTAGLDKCNFSDCSENSLFRVRLLDDVTGLVGTAFRQPVQCEQSNIVNFFQFVFFRRWASKRSRPRHAQVLWGTLHWGRLSPTTYWGNSKVRNILHRIY